VVGLHKVTFAPRKVLGMPVPAMAPLVDSVGGMPYVGTGLKLRRGGPATGAFCDAHIEAARRLAGDGVSLAEAVRELCQRR
jgi:hypothetical protein